MSAPGSRAVVTRENVETAQAVIDAWLEAMPNVDNVDPSDDWNATKAHLRGLITQALADAHANGYDEGVVTGRRLTAQTVRDALENEGL